MCTVELQVVCTPRSVPSPVRLRTVVCVWSLSAWGPLALHVGILSWGTKTNLSRNYLSIYSLVRPLFQSSLPDKKPQNLPIEFSMIHLVLFLLHWHLPHADVVGDGLLGSGGGKGYLYSMDIPSNEQGILSFASTHYSVHENSMSAIITITRSCNAAQAKLCAGDVSVKYSTETIPNIPLPGTFTVTTGSNIVTPTADLRDLLFNSDQLRIPWEEHRLDPILTMDHSVTNFNHGQDIQPKNGTAPMVCVRILVVYVIPCPVFLPIPFQWATHTLSPVAI